MEASIYDFDVQTLRGEPQSMSQYRGKTLLVVNVASACGFTPQYEGLEALYRKYRDKGLLVLGFPCNQFGGQEPGSPYEIAAFCRSKYDVTFPLFAKIDVNGPQAHPLFEHLKAAQRGALGTKSIKWNFTKFLINARGEVVGRYGSSTTPQQIEDDVAALIASTPS
jgi:glutathione peroxidase